MGILSRFFPRVAARRPGVYRIRNVANKKIYIGATARSIQERIEEHARKLDGGWHHNKALQKDWQQYGSKCFRFEIVEVVADVDRVFEREKYWLQKGFTAIGRYNPPVGSQKPRTSGAKDRRSRIDTPERYAGLVRILKIIGRSDNEEHLHANLGGLLIMDDGVWEAAWKEAIG